MLIKNLHYATVIDNDSQNSPDAIKNNAIKIRIPYLMNGIIDDNLPWALPFYSSTGGSDEHGNSCIPEKNSLVWVFFYDEKLNKNLFYIADINLTNFGSASLFEDNAKSNITGFSSSYPDIKFIYLKNGVSIAISSNDSSPEIAIYHPEGAYFFINSSGEIHLKGSNGSLEFSALGETLKQFLSDILDAIIGHTHATAALGAPSPPVNAATFTALKTVSLSTILSQSIKNS